jgi:hypothetical protein
LISYYILTFIYYYPYLLIKHVKEDEMCRAFSTNGEKMKAYRILVGKPDKRTRKSNIKIDLRETVWNGMDWIDRLRIGTSGGLLLSTVMNHKMLGNS